jgi:glycerol-3-phosphate cytidylyltransferase-like family protein
MKTSPPLPLSLVKKKSLVLNIHSDAKIVYLAGAWDMFHAGHIDTLEVITYLSLYQYFI